MVNGQEWRAGLTLRQQNYQPDVRHVYEASETHPGRHRRTGDSKESIPIGPPQGIRLRCVAT